MSRAGGVQSPNVYRIDGNVAYIRLTKGQETKIDIDDLNLVLTRRWHATWAKHVNGYYARAGSYKTQIMLHRFLTDAPKGMVVDHSNHDTLDNRRSNLVITTRAGNGKNRSGAMRNNVLGVRGVSAWQRNGDKMYYRFICDCRSCPDWKSFPYTNEGLAAATAYSLAHHNNTP